MSFSFDGRLDPPSLIDTDISSVDCSARNGRRSPTSATGDGGSTCKPESGRDAGRNHLTESEINVSRHSLAVSESNQTESSVSETVGGRALRSHGQLGHSSGAWARAPLEAGAGRARPEEGAEPRAQLEAGMGRARLEEGTGVRAQLEEEAETRAQVEAGPGSGPGTLQCTGRTSDSDTDRLTESNRDRNTESGKVPGQHRFVGAKREGETPESMGIIIGRPNYPQYAIMSKRLETFSTWPPVEGIATVDMAAAGFAYLGMADACRCYYCGGGLRNWNPFDDPWHEHALHYRSCAHVRQCKGDEYIRGIHGEATERCDEVEVDCLPSAKPTVEKEGQHFDNVMESTAVKTAKEFGSSEANIVKAVQYLTGPLDKTSFSAMELMKVIQQIQDGLVVTKDEQDNARQVTAEPQGHTSTSSDQSETDTSLDIDGATSIETDSKTDLLAENRRLKERINCKICLDELACIIFLPCGHMVTCPQCAPALRRCAICRTQIKGSVRAYMRSEK